MPSSEQPQVRKRTTKAHLTPVLLGYLDALRDLVRTKRYAPTQRELADALQVSSTAARKSVVRLTKLGLLETTDRAARSVVITRRGQDVLRRRAREIAKAVAPEPRPEAR